MFHFKQFCIQQDQCAMKVGTDAVLLGAWVPCGQNIKRVLDIGTGSGCIALMLAQRTLPSVHIDALEIDIAAARQATQNVLQSPWSGRVTVIAQALQQYTPSFAQPYDLLVCNPPYFENSLKANEQKRTTARHTDSLPFSELCFYAANLLTFHGLFCLILPTSGYASFIQNAQAVGFSICYKTLVYTRPNKPAKRVLLALCKDPSYNDYPLPYLNETSFSILNAPPDETYTAIYRYLTQDFYTGF